MDSINVCQSCFFVKFNRIQTLIISCSSMYVAIYIPSGKKGSEISQQFTFRRLLFVVQMYSKFGWPNDEIGQKMANGQLLFPALHTLPAYTYVHM